MMNETALLSTGLAFLVTGISINAYQGVRHSHLPGMIFIVAGLSLIFNVGPKTEEIPAYLAVAGQVIILGGMFSFFWAQGRTVMLLFITGFVFTVTAIALLA